MALSDLDQAEVVLLNRQRRKSCLLKLLTFWFSLLVVIILGMIFIRSNVERDPAEIEKHVSTLFAMDLPQGYTPYSKSDFFAAHTISYWDQNHLREDGRTTSLIAIYYENRWKDWPVEQLIEASQSKMNERLERNSFHTNEKEILTREVHGETVQIFRFRGVTRMEEKLLEATTCYRYVQTSVGPVQIQTLGLNSDFSEDHQIAFLLSIRPPEGQDHVAD